MRVEVTGWLAVLAFLVAGAVSLASRWRPRLGTWRRPVGVLAWGLASLHAGLSLVAIRGLGVAFMDRWEALPHVRSGALAWLLLTALAATSPTSVRRRLSPASWEILHRAVIPVAALLIVHLVAAPRADPVGSLLGSAAIAVLTAARVVLQRRRGGERHDGARSD